MFNKLLILIKYLTCLNNMLDHFLVLAAPAFFWTFWAALSWAFCWIFLSLLAGFLSLFFLAAKFLFLYFIYLTASSARAFLSSGRAVFIFLISSRVTPSIALYFLKTFFFLFFPWSDNFSFLCNLLHAVVHLNLCAFNFLTLIKTIPETKISISFA